MTMASIWWPPPEWAWPLIVVAVIWLYFTIPALVYRVRRGVWPGDW